MLMEYLVNRNIWIISVTGLVLEICVIIRQQLYSISAAAEILHSVKKKKVGGRA